ncbi:hypothetical protein GCM10018780_71160 [Streptomyces lanatus]|nr:hypothetical protein GCM10018780_71160 [Streptomyces lanatus]
MPKAIRCGGVENVVGRNAFRLTQLVGRGEPGCGRSSSRRPTARRQPALPSLVQLRSRRPRLPAQPTTGELMASIADRFMIRLPPRRPRRHEEDTAAPHL